jgi:hypothetical protein
MEDNPGRKNVRPRIWKPENRSRYQSGSLEQIYSNRSSNVGQSRLTPKRERDCSTKSGIHATKPVNNKVVLIIKFMG